jgi:hypothetical protein
VPHQCPKKYADACGIEWHTANGVRGIISQY